LPNTGQANLPRRSPTGHPLTVIVSEQSNDPCSHVTRRGTHHNPGRPVHSDEEWCLPSMNREQYVKAPPSARIFARSAWVTDRAATGWGPRRRRLHACWRRSATSYRLSSRLLAWLRGSPTRRAWPRS